MSEQIAFGTCLCGRSGQLFGAGWCAHCMIQWQDVRISALTQVNQELRSLVHGVNKSSTFGPIDGNPENTALENWFPISADELDRLQAENALLRKGVKCQYAEDVGMPEHRCAVECQYVLQQKESGIPDLCPRGTCGVRIPNCPECSTLQQRLRSAAQHLTDPTGKSSLVENIPALMVEAADALEGILR